MNRFIQTCLQDLNVSYVVRSVRLNMDYKSMIIHAKRPRGYAYLSNRHEPITKHEYGKTYILSKVIVSYMDGDGYIALHAQPLYTITFNKAPF